jgi:hypothetical protein
MSKRVGANRRRLIDEQRTGKPRVKKQREQQAVASSGVMKACRRVVTVVAFAAASGFAAFTYGPTVFTMATDLVKSGNRLHTNVKIVNCGKFTQVSLMCALDSLLRGDSFAFDRAAVLRAASVIPEIEKISVRKIRDRKSRERITLIKVTERKPVALVHGGDISLVDKKGVLFAAAPGRFYDLPLLVVDGGGTHLGDTIDLRLFNTIKKVSRGLGTAFFSEISQIDVSGGTTVNLTFKACETEYVVNSGEIEGKLAHVKRVRERLLEEDNAGPARIDMRYGSLAFTSAQ